MSATFNFLEEKNNVARLKDRRIIPEISQALQIKRLKLFPLGVPRKRPDVVAGLSLHGDSNHSDLYPGQ